jgi:homogentisate 1,2-dioxygenase
MPVTPFAVKERYTYLEGLNNYHQSEAFPGANPVGMNSPQKPALGLLTERISGSSFTAPRDHNLQTWLYRTVSSLSHSEYTPCGLEEKVDGEITPNSYLWLSFPVSDTDWTTQRLLSSTGDASTKTGLAIRLFHVSRDMAPNTVFSSLDGDMLVIVQAGGALDIQTELGNILVRPNEIAVIPRGVRHRVTLPNGPVRGYICELFQGHFRLPELGPIGSCSLANQRDFQIPIAVYDGKLDGGIAVPNKGKDWTIISRLSSTIWSCTQDHTPFDVAGWHGTFYPYKYDLARFSVLGSILFDHPDPSIFTVLTAPSHRNPGTSVADFAIIPPRWNMMEDTYWPPYYHRNTMSEFSGPIVYDQQSRWHQEKGFGPYGASLTGTMTSHGPGEGVHREAREGVLVPKKVGTEGVTIFLLETECPMRVQRWAVQALRAQKKGEAAKL